MPMVLNFLNVLVKNALQRGDYKQIGRLPKFFLEREKRDINAHELEMWPGYLTTTRLVQDGIFLNVDTVSKFIQQRTILDFINDLEGKGLSQQQICNLFDSSNVDEPRRTVLTKYNTKSYQVDGLDYKMNPQTYTFEWKYKNAKGEDIKTTSNLVEYMARNYKKQVTRPK